jgi:hypothetical protein
VNTTCMLQRSKPADHRALFVEDPWLVHPNSPLLPQAVQLG